ncbi:MAG TPA: hypothetical protein [Caudoviricetes sp.]|jgi:hypothetical protein|nr:MAG TPA: hypothetical protein [Caudoviricetes sp.]
MVHYREIKNMMKEIQVILQMRLVIKALIIMIYMVLQEQLLAV